MMMRKTLLMVLLFAGVFTVKAQDEEAITDDQLKTYAEVMVWAENEKEALSTVVSDSVAIWLEGTGLSPSKYMELSKADKKGDLESADASPAEFDEYAKIQDRIDTKAEKFKETYVSKIKDDIGAGLYNKIKGALKADAEVKSRYDDIYSAVKTDTEGETGDA